MSDLHNPIFQNEDAAREYLEANRWEDGPYCPHCGETNKVHRLEGSKHRKGLWQCNGCRQQFSVTVGTVFERSKVPLHKWLLATHLLTSSKKGMSAHQLHRMLGVTYKTAWFMFHRLREAFKGDSPGPMGGNGSPVEADETYIGSTGWEFLSGIGWQRKRGRGEAKAIVALVERNGRARAFHVDRVNSKSLRNLLVTNVSRDSVLNTDELNLYQGVGREFARHDTVQHSTYEYVRGDAHTNTVEGFFSIFKRGMKGVYQHCNERHLQRYLDEFGFRYSNRGLTDAERRDQALKGISGKRLTYRRTDKRANQQA